MYDLRVGVVGMGPVRVGPVGVRVITVVPVFGMSGSVATWDVLPVRPLEALEASGALQVEVALPDARLEVRREAVVVP